MITEIYSKSVDNFDYNPKAVDVTDELQAYYQTIKNVLLGEIGAVFGAENMPVDLESYVYSMGLNNQQIRELVVAKIREYCPLHTKFETQVDVKFGRGDIREICWVDIIVDGSKLTSFLIK